MAAFKVLETQFQMFINSRIYLDDEYVVITRNYFLQYTQLAIPEFRDTLIQHMESIKKSIDERAHHKIDGTETVEQDTSSRSGNDAHVDDAYIIPIYDEEPVAETVGLTWVPTGKIFTSSTTKFDNKPTTGSNADITNQYECEQTLDVSAGDANREITVTETFHLQTDDELSDKELRQIEADDQAIQTILLGLPEDVYAAVDSCETAQEIWLRPERSRHVTIVHQTKDLHTADYTQLYDFIKYNQKEVDELKAERIAKNQDPLALMANSNNPYAFPAPHQDQSSFNQKQMQMVRGNGGNQIRQYAWNPTGYNDVIGNQNGLIGVQGNGNQNQIGNGNLVTTRTEGNAAGQNGNQIRCYNYRGVGHYARNCTVRPRRRDASYLQTQLLIAQKEDAGIQIQEEEYDLM
nr:hypothetical protein [Tanacetum cinerariifolium]